MSEIREFIRATRDSQADSWPGRWWKASATGVASVADRSQQAERLAQMKSEFLVAQQRRRDKSPHAADGPVDPDHHPPIAGERTDAASAAGSGVAALEPCN